MGIPTRSGTIMDPSTSLLRHRATQEGGAKGEDNGAGTHGGGTPAEEIKAQITEFRTRARTISQVVTVQKIILIVAFIFFVIFNSACLLSS
jgi:hypothetical protein